MASDNLVDGEAVTSTRTRAEKTKRSFFNAAGETSPRARLDSIGGKIIFLPSGEELDFNWDDLTPEVQRAAGLFGIMTSTTNTVGRAGMTDDEMFQAASDRLGTILDGEWSAERQSGPRTSDLIEAAERAYTERGMTLSEEKIAEFKAKLSDEKTGPEFRAEMLSKTLIKAHFEAIKAERAAARAAKAKTAVTDDDLDI
jgi:hypothetical protein